MSRVWLALGLIFAPFAFGKPVITWLQADLQPYFFQSGAQQASGALDSAQDLLIKTLPQYQHDIRWLPLVRREQELNLSAHAACSFAMLKTAERPTLRYSVAVAAAPGYAVVMTGHSKLYQRWLQQKPDNIARWLVMQKDVTGLMESGRAKPEFVRRISGGRFIVFPLQTNPVALLAHGRADYWIEYPARANYLLAEYPDRQLQLHSVFLQPDQVSLSYVACSPATPDHVMQDINTALKQLLPQQPYQQALYKWNDTESMQQLLKLYQQHVLQE